MKKRIVTTTLAVLAIAGGIFACLAGGTTTLPGQFILQDASGSPPTCSTAASAGELCVEGDIETNANLEVDGTSTLTGAVTMSAGVTASTTLGVTGDITASGGAGALTFSDSASSIVLPDNDTTALLVGSTGQLNLLTMDTGDDTETVIVTGTTTATAFHVDTGTALIDEDLSIGGGAGALTFTDSASSIVLPDNDTTALLVGSTGTLNLITIDTTDSAEKVAIAGTLTVTDFDNAVVVQGDAPATCTLGQWFWDTGGAAEELCYCQASDTLKCATFAAGPTD